MHKRDEEWLLACQRFESMTVSEAEGLTSIQPTLAQPDEPLLTVAQKAVEHPACLVVSVVDGAGKLLGLLPTRDLAFGTFIHVMPETFLKYANDLSHGGEFATLSHGRTAGDVMRPPQSVRADECLEDAFGLLLKANLDGLPVVTDDRRVVGYLSLFEFLCVWINVCPVRERQPQDEGGDR